ncbi:MAG: hypothetical protein RIE73_26610 [Coleofasciculus sp. C1-SOL-03]|uniref:hypothetical protein n=1 Tax=Coleofasciculus sp. C1-SOL-03 TaxID=3069522 RepID=UPI0032FA4CAF
MLTVNGKAAVVVQVAQFLHYFPQPNCVINHSRKRELVCDRAPDGVSQNGYQVVIMEEDEGESEYAFDGGKSDYNLF